MTGYAIEGMRLVIRENGEHLVVKFESNGPYASLRMTAQQARAFGEVLIAKANVIEARNDPK